MSKGFNKILENFEKELISRLSESPEEVNEHIVKVKGGYELKSKKGNKNLGKYPTKAGAEKREKQVQYFKHANEDAPEGWSGTVKAMKKHKEIDNPFALANYMKKKGDTPHYAEESAVYEDRFNAVMLKDILNGLEEVQRLRDVADSVSDKEYADHHADNLSYELDDLRDYLEYHPEYASHPMVEKIYTIALRMKVISPVDVPAIVGTMTESGELWRGETFNADDPEVLIHGYGRLLRSQLTTKISGYLADMSEKAKQGNLGAVKYMLENSPLKSLVDAALDADEELRTLKR